MADYDLSEQAWALSALFLAVEGVNALAENGQWPEVDFATLMPSLVRLHRPEMRAYYDHPERLVRGRDRLVEMLTEGAGKATLHYAIQLMMVEKRLAKNAPLMEVLRKHLAQAESQADQFGLVHDTMFARFGDTYQQTVSQAARRIQIHGNPRYLQQASIAAQLRTLMLCGVRAAALWRANGGNRWQFMFSRRAIAEAAMALDFTENS